MKVLVLYHAGFSYTPTIEHYLTAFKRHSAHEVRYFNVDQQYDVPLDLSGYDAVFVNFCVASAAVARINPPPFMLGLVAALRWYRGVKIVAAQDEYDFTNSLKRFFLQIKADIIFTCVPQSCLKLVYPEIEFANVQFETVQTAYLSEDLLEVDPAEILPLADRTIPLGYRGRNLPYRLGEIGWHKSEVGVQFKQACMKAGIRHDIEVAEEKRFVGDEWLQFVRRCRVMLGSPSGANVFDFDGELHERMTSLYHANTNLMYEDVRDEVSAYEIDRDMGQVSARVYEAVAQRTALALVRGSYSGVLEPDAHYVPIETDYSNVETVLNRILNVSVMQAMADRAYTHVVNDPRNRFAYLVKRFDDLIDACDRVRARKGVRSPRSTAYPQGCDLYLLAQLTKLRADYHSVLDYVQEFIKLVAENRIEVVAHPDGTYRVLKHSEPDTVSQQYDSDWEALVHAAGWFRWSLVVLVFLVGVFFAGNAMAQRACDQFNAAQVTGTNPPVVRVPGVSGQSVYLCGYVIVHTGGSTLEFELTSGTGNNCQVDTTILIPRMGIPTGTSLVNRIGIASGEYTPVGHSLCSQTFGDGSLYTIFYWAQF